MSWLDWVKRKLVGKSAPGESDGVDEDEAPAVGGEPGEESTAALLEEAWARDAEGDLDGANGFFSEVIKRGPNASAYYGRGVVRCKLQRYPAAIADLNRAIRLRPRFAAALTERGLAYVESGEVEKAIQDYDAAIAIDPSYGVAHENKGAACLMLERWAEAVPHLDIALRLAPSHGVARYNRGIAHEMLGDLPRAIRDFQDSVRASSTGIFAPHAEQRLRALQARAGDIPKPEWPAPESLWTQLVPLSLEDTVADLVQKAHAEGAFFGLVTLPDGGKLLAPFYGKDGIRKHLTEIADVIGPRILTLKLGQFDALFGGPAGTPPSQGEEDAERLVEGRALQLITHGERILGVFTDGCDYHYPDLPTVLFGERPTFERRESAETARRCSSCGHDVAYFDDVIEDDKLAGYACPHCTASPTQAWVEERMRPGGWSRCGFLGETEALRDIMARDTVTLQRLGVGHAQIADALDRLLAQALLASEERIARATEQFEEELQASGMHGVPGLAVLPLGLSLDALEKRLRDGGRIPTKRGTAVDDHNVFLQIYLGYQYCPFTRLRLPWSDDVPKMEVVRRRVKGVVHLTAATDRCLPCRSELSYRYGNLEFLIVHRETGRFLRGSGLLVHLIRDHCFFEGEESPFRLDPERAAHVLGISS
ncbi:tetratricopeptide repeat protein [Sorangium sp. KYC3313]|uniref:tetratricopeptide repeat protein n=1 Tax=Sorangium sp. KYC3313 TaxID=3449740 RepID=UPI003F8A8AB8